MEKESLFEDITHDDDQLSTKTTQDHEDDGIMETEEYFEKKEDDGIMETEEYFEKKESLFEDNVCYILYLIVGVL